MVRPCSAHCSRKFCWLRVTHWSRETRAERARLHGQTRQEVQRSRSRSYIAISDERVTNGRQLTLGARFDVRFTPPTRDTNDARLRDTLHPDPARRTQRSNVFVLRPDRRRTRIEQLRALPESRARLARLQRACVGSSTG